MTQDQSMSMNDDYDQINNKYLDDEENKHKNLRKSSSTHKNNTTEKKSSNNDHVNKTSSSSNVFNRLIHSEPHVSKALKSKTAAAAAHDDDDNADALRSFIITLFLSHSPLSTFTMNV